METKIILVIVAICMSVISMVLSTVFHVWNLRDIRKTFSAKELSKQSNDCYNNASNSNKK